MKKCIKQVRFIFSLLKRIEDIFKVEENKIRRQEKYFSSFIYLFLFLYLIFNS